MTGLIAIGLDPGPHTGIAWLEGVTPEGKWLVHALQCDHEAVPFILDSLFLRKALDPARVAFQAEKFETGNRAGAKGEAADITRAVFHEARLAAERHGARFYYETAHEAKAYAHDKRLLKIRFPMEVGAHGRDGGRHLMRVSVMHCGVPDPLIRRARLAA